MPNDPARSIGTLAVKLKQLRRQKHLTLKQLGENCGISAATLSKIENGQLSPTYEKIAALAQGLNINVGDLFTPHTPPPLPGRRSVNRNNSGLRHETDQYLYEMLHTDLTGKRFIPLIATLKAHQRTDFPQLLKHEGEEFLYVLSGKVTLLTEFYPLLELNPGDSCYYDSKMGHACISGDSEDARILWISHTLSFRRPEEAV